MNKPSVPWDVVVIGAGPAGLAAAEGVASAGLSVLVVDAARRPGVKFLVAGRSGLNITRDATAAEILAAVPAAAQQLRACVNAHPPAAIRAWMDGLQVPSFIGSSGKVFPQEQQGKELLERWLHRLQGLGVEIRCGHRVSGLRRHDGRWLVELGQGQLHAQSVLLAMGGASWPQTGSDGQWCSWLAELGLNCSPWQAANCGVEIAWDDFVRQRFAGQPLKNIALSSGSRRQTGEVVITDYGLEGYALYPLIPSIRAQLAADGKALIHLDLCAQRGVEEVAARLLAQGGNPSVGKRLRSALRLGPLVPALLRCSGVQPAAAGLPLAEQLKALPLRVSALRPIAEAISSAGGLCWSALDDDFQCRHQPGLYAVGEMVDWEAPTGGYLLTICLAMGRWAAAAILRSRAP